MRPSLGPSALLASLALVTCKPASSPLAPPTSLASAAEPTTTITAEPEAPPAPVVYGQFRIPDPTSLVEQVRNQLVPPAQRGMFDVSILRSMIGSTLGPRGGVAERVDLSRPMGCVVTSPKRHDVPLACVVGYRGGLDQLVEDLGAEGYVSGGEDYAAYRFEGQALYLNAMGDHVAFSFAPELTAATRDRLQRDIIGAPAGAEDLAGTVYPGTIFEDAHDEIEDLIERGKTPATTATEYQRLAWEARRRQLLSFGELERADLWLDLAPAGLRLGYRGQARAGTPTRKAYDGQPELRHDLALLELMPAEAFLLGSMRFDVASMFDDPLFGSYAQVMNSLDSSDAGAAFAQVFRESLSAWIELSTGHATIAMMHVRGTKGGFVVAYRLQAGADASAKLREIFERYEALPPDGPLPFEFELKRGTVRAGKVRGDVVTMRPSAKAQDLLQNDPGWAILTKALGGSLALQTAYAQRDDVLYMAMAPQKAERYLQRALAAGAGKRNLESRKEAMELLGPHSGDSMVLMTDVGEVLGWLVAIGAMDAPRKPVGGKLDDVVLSMRPGPEPGQREVVVEVSQSLLDGLLTLAG